jgi:ribosomal protein L37E
MATSPLLQRENCTSCGQQTKHAVTLEIRQEGDSGADDVVYSREPYRVTICRRCGTEQGQRMNDA